MANKEYTNHYDIIADKISGEYAKSDIKMGDWVLACRYLPGICRSINLERDDIEIVQPDIVLRDDKPKLPGMSCSLRNCGVHKINPEWAMILFSVGEKYLGIFYFEDPETIPELKGKGYDKVKTYEGRVIKYYIEEIVSKHEYYDDPILRKYDPSYKGAIKPIITK